MQIPRRIEDQRNSILDMLRGDVTRRVRCKVTCEISRIAKLSTARARARKQCRSRYIYRELAFAIDGRPHCNQEIYPVKLHDGNVEKSRGIFALHIEEHAARVFTAAVKNVTDEED